MTTNNDASLWWGACMTRSGVLRAVCLDPPQLWRHVPPQWQQDPSFIVQFLLHSKVDSLPSKDDFERNFTPQVRQSRAVLLAWTKRPDFATLYEQRHLYVPEQWLGDKEIMLAYAKTIPRSLQECSDELRMDRDMVVTSIQRNGLELQYASEDWQGDEEIVRMACANHVGALEFCSSLSLRQKLLQDFDFVHSLYHNCSEENIPHVGKIARFLKEPLRSNPDLLLTALQFRILSFSDICCKYQKDQGFATEALKRRANIYLEPAFRFHWGNHVDLAKTAILSSTSNEQVIDAVLKQLPDLEVRRAERNIIEALFDRASIEYVKTLISSGLPRIRFDPQLMLRAVQRDPSLYALSYVVDDPAITMQAMTPDTAVSILREKSMEFRLAHPAVVCHALATATRWSLVEPLIPAALWSSSLLLQQAWLRRVGTWRPAFPPPDTEMALWVAEHVPTVFFNMPREQVPTDDEVFLRRALQVSGGRLLTPLNATRFPKNIEFAVAAVAANPAALSLTGFTKDELRTYLQERLTDWDNFFLVLCEIGLGEDGPLSLLNVGNETGVALKQSIASFIGLPVPESLSSLQLYEQAYYNLYQECNKTAPTIIHPAEPVTRRARRPPEQRNELIREALRFGMNRNEIARFVLGGDFDDFDEDDFHEWMVNRMDQMPPIDPIPPHDELVMLPVERNIPIVRMDEMPPIEPIPPLDEFILPFDDFDLPINDPMDVAVLEFPQILLDDAAPFPGFLDDEDDDTPMRLVPLPNAAAEEVLPVEPAVPPPDVEAPVGVPLRDRRQMLRRFRTRGMVEEMFARRVRRFRR